MPYKALAVGTSKRYGRAMDVRYLTLHQHEVFRDLNVKTICTHLENYPFINLQPLDFMKDCKKCKDATLARVRAVDLGHAYLGEQDYRQDSGIYSNVCQNVVLVNKNVTGTEEFYRSYARSEICLAIRLLAQNGGDELGVGVLTHNSGDDLVNPIRLAYKVELYWPIIYHYGSIYDALLMTLGKQRTKEIYKGCYKAGPDMLEEEEERESFIRCGNTDHCNKICHQIGSDGGGFSKCARCKLRRYCSATCQKKDWKLHKPECFPRMAD